MVFQICDLKVYGYLLFVFGAIFLGLMAQRALAAPFLVASLVLSPLLIRRKQRRLLAFLWVLFFAATFVPIDVTFRDYPGGPHFVPLIMGLPGEELFEQARRGDVFLGGCMVTGFEPKWVLVW